MFSFDYYWFRNNSVISFLNQLLSSFFLIWHFMAKIKFRIKRATHKKKLSPKSFDELQQNVSKTFLSKASLGESRLMVQTEVFSRSLILYYTIRKLANHSKKRAYLLNKRRSKRQKTV